MCWAASAGPLQPRRFLLFWLKRELSSLKFALFVPFQIGGAILGSHVAHAMFQKKIYYFGGKDRDSGGEFFSEALAARGSSRSSAASRRRATCPARGPLHHGGLLVFVLDVLRGRGHDRPIGTGQGASIATSWPAFMGGQAVGLVVGLPMCEWPSGASR